MHLATQRGLVSLQRQADGTWSVQQEALADQDINVIAHRPGAAALLFAGTYGNGLWRSQDHGRHWQRLDLPLDYIRAIAFAPDTANTVYVGTEPARLYTSTDQGASWTDLGLGQLPQAPQWRLPYSPRAGALRSLALHPRNPALIYGAVEQGGVLRSADRGLNWTIAQDDLDADVHWLSVHPADPAVVLAATGGGLYRSRDSATSWQQLLPEYIRAVEIHPLTPRLILAGPAGNVGELGRILLSQDGGASWQPAENGLCTPLSDMINEFVLHPALPGQAFAIRSGGMLLETSLDQIDWRPFQPSIPLVQDLDLAV